MRIYTKFGDSGETALLSGKKVAKSHPRVEAYGEVDELNAFLGLVIAFADEDYIRKPLIEVQKDLFIMGAELSTENAKANVKSKKISPVSVSALEKIIDEMEKELPALHHFILPGGSKTASVLHLARTVCRRVERKVVALSQKEKVNPAIVIYLNRLGDLLFIMARQTNRRKRVEEREWKGHRRL